MQKLFWFFLNFRTKINTTRPEKGAHVDLYLKDNIAIETMRKFYVEIYYERNTTERLYKKSHQTRRAVEQISGPNPS
jgi:hypothetical protein